MAQDTQALSATLQHMAAHERVSTGRNLRFFGKLTAVMEGQAECEEADQLGGNEGTSRVMASSRVIAMEMERGTWIQGNAWECNVQIVSG